VTTVTQGQDRRQHAREAIIDVAAQLLQQRGPAAVTTRGVAEAAGVQAPTIYRLFGDKDGLLDAVAEHVLGSYIAAKAADIQATASDVDPLVDLRRGWDTHVGFGLANPALFTLLNDPGRQWPAAADGFELLRGRLHRVALAGRLRVGVARAAHMMHAAGTGAVLSVLALPPEQRDAGLADAMYDAVIRAILVEPHDATGGDAVGSLSAAAVSLRAALTEPADEAQPAVLTAAEQALLSDWLDRIIDAAEPVGGSGSAVSR
jgi:AcrR family transcriptional regulator